MGRRTYDSFAAVWPTRAGDSFTDRLNAMPKYVASTALRAAGWTNTTVIATDLIGRLQALKREPGKDILQYGLGPVSFAMLEHALLDEIRLARLRLADSRALSNGIVILRYEVERAAI
jgi:dihydrofolate reductase